MRSARWRGIGATGGRTVVGEEREPACITPAVALGCVFHAATAAGSVCLPDLGFGDHAGAGEVGAPRCGGDSNDQTSDSTALTQTVNPDTPSGTVALTGQYVESSAAFKALSPQMQQAITTAVNDASQWLTKISPRLNATGKARLIAFYDQAIGYLQSKGYLTAEQVSTLKAVAGGI